MRRAIRMHAWRYAVVVLAALLAAGLGGSARADGPMGDNQLFNAATDAYNSSNFFDAARYYTAYLERPAAEVRNQPDTAEQVQGWLADSAYEVAFEQRALAAYKDGFNQLRDLIANSCQSVGSTASGIANGVAVSTTHAQFLRYGYHLPVRKADTDQSASTPPSYPMVCQGGGSMSFRLETGGASSAQTQLTIKFGKAPSGFGNAGQRRAFLAPGQCTWLDRAIYPNEPNTILFNQTQLLDSPLSVQWTAGGSFQVQGGPDALRILRQGRGSYAAVNVYNDNNGHFVVTGAGTVPGR